MQSIVSSPVGPPLLSIVDYGHRFRVLRKARWRGTVMQLSQRLGGKGYPTTVYNIERQWRVPMLLTIAKHAKALGCTPWELLDDVETEYDRVRALALLPPDQAIARWDRLLAKYRKTTARGSKRQKNPGRSGEGHSPTRPRRQAG